MDSAKSECYEFLDLSDVDDSERNQLKESLFGNSQSDLLQLPWASNKKSNNTNNSNNNSSNSNNNNNQYPEPVVYSQQWLQHPTVPPQYGVPMPQSGMLLTNASQTPFYPVLIQPVPLEDGYYYIAEELSMTESPIPGDSDQQSGRDSPSISGVSTGSSGVMSPHSGVGGVHPPPQVYTQPPPPVYVAPTVPPAPAAPGYTPQHPQNVFVSNVTANVNLHGYVPGPFIPSQGYGPAPPPVTVPSTTEHEVRTNGNGRGRIRSRNVSRHRQNDVESSPPVNPPYMPQYMPISPFPATYYAQPAPIHASAQHAAGSPLYIAPMYTYGGYPAAPSTLVYPAGGGMHVSADYQYNQDAQATPHTVQEVPVEHRDNTHSYQNTVNNTVLPQQPLHPPPNMVSVIVNSKLDNQQTPNKQKQSSKQPYLNTQVQIKQNLRHENFEMGKPQLVVVTPLPDTNGTNVNVGPPEHHVEPIKDQTKLTNGKTPTTQKVKTAQVQSKPKPPPGQSNNKPPASVPAHDQTVPTSENINNVTIPSKPPAPGGKQSESAKKITNPPNSVQPMPVTPTQHSVAAEAPLENTQIGTNTNKIQNESTESNEKPPNLEKQKTNVKANPVPQESVSAEGNKNSPKEIAAVFKKVMNIKDDDSTSGNTAPNSGDNINTVKQPSTVATSPVPKTETNTAATNGATKSWASLFTKPSDNNTSVSTTTVNVAATAKPASKPLARVQPFESQPTKPVNKENARNVVTIVQKNKPYKSPNSVFLDDPSSYRIGEFLTKYIIDNRTVSLLPRGLTNRSNYCYVNSILQALLACPPFYNLIRAIPQMKSAKEKSPCPVIDSMVELVNEFSPLPAGARVGRREKNSVAANQKGEALENVNCGPALEPACVYQALNMIRSDSFSLDGRQEDAEEFLGCLLNSLNDEMVELIKLVEDNVTDSTTVNGKKNNPEDLSDEDEWKVMGPKNKGSITRRTEFSRSPVSDIFRGQLRSRVQRAGDQSTDNVQPFFTLQLDIEKATSVKEALEILVGKDRLEGVTCSRTQQAVEAWQQVSLEELPLVLILHLKCFNYERDTCSKIIKNVEFPVDLKIDSKLMSANKKYTNKQKQYKLFAVVYHDGKEATKGHYITDAFHVGYGGWVRYDDSSVRGVSEAQVLRPRAPRMPYLLYYRRCDTIGNQGAQTQSKRE